MIEKVDEMLLTIDLHRIEHIQIEELIGRAPKETTLKNKYMLATLGLCHIDIVHHITSYISGTFYEIKRDRFTPS